MKDKNENAPPEEPGVVAKRLSELLKNGEAADLLVALRQVADAHGGVRAVAEKAALNPNQLYRTLSPRGNPELRSLLAVLKSLDLCLAIQPA